MVGGAMKNFLFFLMGLAMAWGVVMCQEARADHWMQTDSLKPGTYMLIYENQTATAQMLSMQTYADLQGLSSTLNFVSVNEAVVITIDEQHTCKKLVEFLNADPVTVGAVIFRQDKIGWHQIPSPFIWVEGDLAL